MGMGTKLLLIISLAYCLGTMVGYYLGRERGRKEGVDRALRAFRRQAAFRGLRRGIEADLGKRLDREAIEAYTGGKPRQGRVPSGP